MLGTEVRALGRWPRCLSRRPHVLSSCWPEQRRGLRWPASPRAERERSRVQARETQGVSFDHLVGAGEERGRNGEAECFGRLQVEDKIKPSWLLDRDVARFRAAQDFINVVGGAPEQVRKVRSIGHQG